MIDVKFNQNGLIKFGKAFGALSTEAINEIREATFYAQSVIVKDFLSVSDGSSLGPRTKRQATPRTIQPGLRTATGTLKRDVQRNTAFNHTIDGFEGVIGTNLKYGVIHEERYRQGKANRRGLSFGFLQPGLEKAMPEIMRKFRNRVRGFLNNL